ncbi:MAG: response regulator, partial [Bacteroidota bacterium]
NAIKFTERGGVAVQIDSADRRVIRFQVADTGPGIPPEQLESVFGAFNRINRPGKLVEGTGLGLNIAKKLAHQMGGDILLTSTLGEGATFTLELPFQYPEQQAVTAFQTNEKPAIDTSKAGRLLVVEDNLMNQIVLRKTLQGAWPNLEVTIATTGKEAIECLHSTAYDLVFMDIQLPDMDGFAITRYLRTQRSASRANIPVLAMTAQTQVTEDERFQEVDMTDYILKPFNRDQLFEKMSAFL